MMRKANLLSSYATVSSITSNLNIISYPSLARSTHHAAFVCSPSKEVSGELKRCNRINPYHHTGIESSFLSSSNRNQIWARDFGSKSMNFQQTFLKTNTVKSSRGNNEVDDGNNGNLTEKEENKKEEEEESDSYNYQPTNEIIKSQSMDWIKKVVIGYNFCPFAERPLKENKLKVSVVRGDDDEYVAGAVAYELISRSDDAHPGTTIVIAPEYHPDNFAKYFSLVKFIEDTVCAEHDSLEGVVQIAPFHPKFEFAGSGEGGVDNYTNRSPYPMFHILREDEVGAAVEKLDGDASKVWSRNVRLLEAMERRWGREGVERAMRGEDMEGVDALLKEVKKLSSYDNDHDR